MATTVLFHASLSGTSPGENYKPGDIVTLADDALATRLIDRKLAVLWTGGDPAVVANWKAAMAPAGGFPVANP
jgi:hypothetical protein